MAMNRALPRSRTSWALAGLLVLLTGGHATAFQLTSPAFVPGGDIPVKHTCDGSDASPPLRWTNPPANTRGFVLIVDDPDAPAGTWVHWVLYGIPAPVRQLPDGVPSDDTVPRIGTQGVNDFHKVGYGGPCPPSGPAHRYRFRLYALDTGLMLSPRRTKAEVLEAIEGHVLGQAQLMGRYKRR
jgi:Raf kinase inhibitor-like YbhB/YbcL family protein